MANVVCIADQRAYAEQELARAEGLTPRLARWVDRVFDLGTLATAIDAKVARHG